MKRTGELLRKAREKRALSLNEIALSLKINSKVLSAIEEGDLSKLPAKTFLRGFVQSYSNYLRLNTDEILALFNEELGMPRTASTTPESSETMAETASTPVISVKESLPSQMMEPKTPALESGLSSIEDGNKTRLLVISGICIVLVVLIFGTKKIIDRYQRESEPPEQVAVTSPLPEPTPAATLPTTGAPASPATVAAPPTAPTEAKPVENKTPEQKPVETKPAPVATAPTTPVPPVTPAHPATVPALATAVPEKKPVEIKPVPPPKPPEVKPPEVKPPAPKVAEQKPVETKPAETKPAETKPTEPPAEKKPVAKNVELIIEALDSVDVEYAGANGPAQKLKLGADQVHTIRSKAGLKITLSNGGAVNLILNGKDLGVPGELGKPITLRY